MKVDILSDLHLDFYFKQNGVTTSEVAELFTPIFTQNNSRSLGDVLVIAGDIGHYNEQNIEILKILQDKYYKYIVCVLGNHDYFISNRIQEDNYEDNSFNRVKQMRDLINTQKNMFCLDGDVVEIDGVKFGGCDGWYDGSYLKYHYPFGRFSQKSNNQLWSNCMNMDFRFIRGISNFDDIFKVELPKIQSVYQECDVMITHINPSYLQEHLSKQYSKQQSNMFFCFNGHEYINNGSMKYWIFGHTHDSLSYKYKGVECICNSMGFHDNDIPIIKSIEIQKEI